MTLRTSGSRTVLFMDHTAAMSGGEIALFQLIESMDVRAYRPVVLLFSDGPLGGRLSDLGIETHIIPLGSKIADKRKDALGGAGIARSMLSAETFGYIRGLRQFLAQLDPDIVHTNSLKADLIGGLAARLARKPLVWHIRDRIAEDYLPRAATRLMRRLCRLVPDRIIANSQATLDTLELPPRMTRPGPGRRGFVVHDGMAPTLPRPHEGNGADAVTGTPKVGLVGRIAPWKGQHVFLDAAAAVHDAYPEVRLLIVGSAMFGEHEYERTLRARCTELGLDGIVEFTGFREDVERIMADLTILVHASTVPEPFGQVVLEGMMAGRPVVATRGGGVTEIVVDGSTGILVPMGDARAMANAITVLLSNPEHARALGAAGRARAETEFTIAKTARKVEAIYDGLLAGRV